MLQQEETLLGVVPVKRLSGSKVGLPLSPSIDHTWVLKKTDFYTECLYEENAVLITPYKKSAELPRACVKINISQECFEIPIGMAKQIGASFYDQNAPSLFEVYRCFEKKLKFKLELKRDDSLSAPTYEFEFFDTFSEEDAMNLLRTFPNGNFSIKVFECIDSLLYKMVSSEPDCQTD